MLKISGTVSVIKEHNPTESPTFIASRYMTPPFMSCDGKRHTVSAAMAASETVCWVIRLRQLGYYSPQLRGAAQRGYAKLVDPAERLAVQARTVSLATSKL
jgi:hypothetical protein